MSAIPPHLPGSFLQATAQARQAQGHLDNDDNQRAGATRSGQAAADQKASAVSDADLETGVDDQNSAGVGGQGRSFSDTDADEPQPDPTDPEGVRRDDDGNLHVDLQA